MGRYLTPGHTYTDGQTVTGPSLTEHVAEATLKATAITEQTLKDPAALTDQLLVVSADALFKTTLQQIHNLILYPGSVVQTVYGEYTANTNLTTVIPADDTIPQNTEGTEIISTSITPRFATSTILCRFQSEWNTSVAISGVAALFKDSEVGAIAATVGSVTASVANPFMLEHMDSPVTTSATSYKIRVGPGVVGTMRLNGNVTSRVLGGVMKATLVLQEIKV